MPAGGASPVMWPIDQNGHDLGARGGQADVGYALRRRERFPTIADLDTDTYDLHLFACSSCDERPLLELDQQERLVRARTACRYPDGVTATFRVRFASGRVVVADDLREAYPAPDGEHSYNSALGQAEVDLASAADGLARGCVGNTSPDIVELVDGTYAIACTDDDEPLLTPAGETAVVRVLGHVTTGVWSYAMADHDDFVARGGDLADAESIIDLPAGTYEFTNHAGARDCNLHGPWPLVFATFRRVAD